MTPSELLDDHALRPRGIGKLLNPSAVGDIGSIVVGDALRFYVTVAKDGAGVERVTAAKFQVFNAAGHMGAASVTTELAVGKTLDEATSLGPTDVCAHLGGLAFDELPPRVWGLEGLRAAIASWRGDELPFDQDLDPLLCRCYGISEETVRQAIAVRGLATVDAVIEATGVAAGCGSCRAEIPRLLSEASGAPAAAPAAAVVAASGRIQLMLRIQRLAEERILPAIRARGGDLELWDFRDGVVRVRAKGALSTDDQSRRAALAELEALLKAEIDPSLGVGEE
jgi:NifU-like protein